MSYIPCNAAAPASRPAEAAHVGAVAVVTGAAPVHGHGNGTLGKILYNFVVLSKLSQLRYELVIQCSLVCTYLQLQGRSESAGGGGCSGKSCAEGQILLVRVIA